MFTQLPMRIEFTSPRSTVLNHMEHSSPMVTSPTTVAFSARKQFRPITGVNPLTDCISGILEIV